MFPPTLMFDVPVPMNSMPGITPLIPDVVGADNTIVEPPPAKKAARVRKSRKKADATA